MKLEDLDPEDQLFLRIASSKIEKERTKERMRQLCGEISEGLSKLRGAIHLNHGKGLTNRIFDQMEISLDKLRKL